ncbi:MAG: hypothetical protein KF901_12905, partial [Myxococcales bacterium]|nr:hypothetical protein [Myxococcales bacterium]
MSHAEPERGATPNARLRHAIALAGRRALAGARAQARAALDEAPDDPLVATVAGLVLFVTRDYGESLDALARAAALGAPPRVHWLRRERAARLGWE